MLILFLSFPKVYQFPIQHQTKDFLIFHYTIQRKDKEGVNHSTTFSKIQRFIFDFIINTYKINKSNFHKLISTFILGKAT